MKAGAPLGDQPVRMFSVTNYAPPFTGLERAIDGAIAVAVIDVPSDPEVKAFLDGSRESGMGRS